MAGPHSVQRYFRFIVLAGVDRDDFGVGLHRQRSRLPIAPETNEIKQSKEKKRLASFIAERPSGPAAATPAPVNASKPNTIVQPSTVFFLNPAWCNPEAKLQSLEYLWHEEIRFKSHGVLVQQMQSLEAVQPGRLQNVHGT